ncbi:winged helix-turn-helix transcriptional regulator [Polaribacter porphyrae]|uniref:HTH hxlR-type domain-containing protein n=1 Tax=Polaribacter porphyrae TaxID=1137780 RepID=A0A2S7WPC8_9FLAO|nr:helix-turn-helix domain-containing protein [Polaribacter porphyrae]PQJ79468.1 hypothetical protein BTO18_09925 [Polaribacter porphyrae]
MNKNILEKIESNNSTCPVSYCLSMIGGKWKPIILYLISKGINRFGVLNRTIEGISKQMLTKQLREMENDGILSRKIFAEIPPRVEYYVTKKGKSIYPIIEAMRIWGETNIINRD